MTNHRPMTADESDHPISAADDRRDAAAATTGQKPLSPIVINSTLPVEREADDEVNRFLLCALVSESAKQIKTSAEQTGESLPMASVVRGVLRAYRVAAKNRRGPLAQSTPDYAGLGRLNRQVLRDEVARHVRERVKTSEARLARAKRIGDDAKIEAETDHLKRALALRDRLAEEYR